VSLVAFPVHRARRRRGGEDQPGAYPDEVGWGHGLDLPPGTIYGDDRSGYFVPSLGDARAGAPGLPIGALVPLGAAAGVGLSLWLGIVRLPELGGILVTTAGALTMAGLVRGGDATVRWLVGALIASLLGFVFGVSMPAVAVAVFSALLPLELVELARRR